MYHRRWTKIALATLLAVAASSKAYCQSAQIAGTVTDPQHAVVVGAEVRIHNTATGVEQVVRTNRVGIYTAPFVQPGSYQVSVQAPGFETASSNLLTLTIGQTLQFDVQLRLGSETQEVTVESGSQLLNTTDGSVSTLIDQRFVENIPLNGRSFQDLISLTPGVVQTGTFSFTVNGQRTESNNYIVDGVSANVSPNTYTGTPNAGTAGLVPAQTALGTTQSLLSVDALQEFRVDSSSYSAENGRYPGAQFAFTSRSGTDSFHGSLFDYLRNNYFDANDWFNNYYGVAEPALRQNDFGGTFGGPVLIPRLLQLKNKTFFFVSYEGLRLQQPKAASAQYVPDTELRQTANPYLQPILNAFPLPTSKNGGETRELVACTTATTSTATPCPAGVANGTLVPSGLAAFNMASSLPSRINSTSVRIDQNVSSKMSVFFRFSDTPSVTNTRSQAVLSGDHANFLTYTGGVTNQFSSTFDNSFRLNYTNSLTSAVSTLDNFGGATPADLKQIIGLDQFKTALPIFFQEVIGVGYASMSTGNTNAFLRQWNVINTAHKSLGHHQLRFGVDYRRIDSPLNPWQAQTTGYFYNYQQIQQNLAYLLLVYKYQSTEPVFNEFGAFVQDEWHVSNRLNLSLGLRWDLNPPPAAGSGAYAYTVTGNLSDPSSLNVAHLNRLWQTTYHNFAPRLGLAYQANTQPGWETVVRAGGGVFFDTDNEVAAYAAQLAASKRWNLQPLPVTQADLDSVVVGPSVPYSGLAFPAHLQLPYTWQWNLAVQQALGRPQTLTITYVGAAGRRLLTQQAVNLTSANPIFGTVTYIPGNVTSDYDALQVQFQRRLSHGLQALASYTWSHSIDEGSAYFETPLVRGNSDFDLRNNFQAALSWNLPDVHADRIASAALSHWAIDGRLFAQTAMPITINGSYLTDPSGIGYTAGVNTIMGAPIYLYGSQYPGHMAISQAAFCDPNLTTGATSCAAHVAAGNIIAGVTGRNVVRGFGNNQLNLAVRREFPLKENLRFQFRAESFNLLNHPNFAGIDATLSDSQFGRASEMLGNGNTYSEGRARSMQFAVKVLF